MIGEILTLIDPCMTVVKKTAPDGRLIKYDLAHSVFDMEAYCKITENFIFEFLESTNLVDIEKEHQKNFLKALKINDRIREEDYYAHVGHMKFNCTKAQKEKREKIISDIKEPDSELVNELIVVANRKLKERHRPQSVKKEDFIWDFNCKFDWGMKTADPISKVPFHNKDKSSWMNKKTREIQATGPEHFQETGIRLYSRNNLAVNEVNQAFDEICHGKEVSTRSTSQGFDHKN